MIYKTDARILKLLDRFKAKNSSGKPFEWREHIFLLDILCDFSPKQATRKCAQVGLSETMILKALFMAEHLKLNVLYTLPSDRFLKDFVPPKVNQIIQNNPELYGNWSGGIYQKEVQTNEGKRYIYFQGAYNPESAAQEETTAKGTSISVDIKIHDEASKSDPFVINQMQSRTLNSKYKGDWKFDNPVYPNMGADADWHRSDQMHWMVKCSHCGYRQYLDWYRLDKHSFESGTFHCWINPEKKIIECGKCRKEIVDGDRIKGEWVPRYPKQDSIRGYWMTQLIYIMHNVESIMEIEENPETRVSYFNNMILGKPYIGSDVKLNRENIVSNLSSDINPLIGNAMGIDQGNIKWYVIGNAKGVFQVGKTESWDELEMLFNKYNCVAVCDALPFQSDPKRMAAKYPGRFYRAFYKPMQDQVEIARFSPEGKVGIQKDIVHIRRNEALDELYNQILENKFPIQAPFDQIQGDYIRHLTSLVRVVEEDSDGNQRFDWINTDQDHLAHATNYFKVALRKANKGSVSLISPKKQGEDNKKQSYESFMNRGSLDVSDIM
jgi:hypothetical protein